MYSASIVDESCFTLLKMHCGNRQTTLTPPPPSYKHLHAATFDHLHLYTHTLQVLLKCQTFVSQCQVLEKQQRTPDVCTVV